MIGVVGAEIILTRARNASRRLMAPAMGVRPRTAQSGPASGTCRLSIWNEAGKDPTGAQHESFYDSTVQEYASMPLEVLSLQQMMDFGINRSMSKEAMLLKSARYVQRELPRRLARRLMDLKLLPYIVVTNPHIGRVYDAYYHAFQTLRLQPAVSNMQENSDFTEMLKRLVDEHAPMLDSLAHGLRECASKPIVGPRLQLDGFLDNMLRSRISRRVLAEQHVHLQLSNRNAVGIIATELSLYEAVNFAAQRTRQVCTETYGRSPDIIVSGDVRAVMPYIPMHIDYMLYELLKNACRAVMEVYTRGPKKTRGSFPPVQVALFEGSHSVTLRISDRGGGITDEELHRVWHYGYTTSKHYADDAHEQEGLGFGLTLSDASQPGQTRFRMAGLGFGLPLSRVYARYFGGDLELKVLPGVGVDAYLILKRLQGQSWIEKTDEYSADAVLSGPGPDSLSKATSTHVER